MNIKKYLEKLQSWPELHKKIVLWTIVAVLAIIMGIFWYRSTMTRISKLDYGSLGLPKLDLIGNTTNNQK